ncbi:MAG: hypothetical protein ACI317_05020 [Floccifex porci]
MSKWKNGRKYICSHNLYETGMDLDKIAKALECKITQVKEWLSTH